MAKQLNSSIKLLKVATFRTKYASALSLLIFASFCCGRVEGVGELCDPSDYAVRHHCRSTRCFSAPPGCHYIHNHYTLDVHNHCCATPCYLVRTGSPGTPCGSGVVETLAPTDAPAPECVVDNDCNDDRKQCVSGVCQDITCDANLPAFGCCVDSDCENAAYQCNRNDYECQLTQCTVGEPENIQCCADSDCTVEGQICESNICLRQGYPRFTLTWRGNDDLDIKVRTPGNVVIFYENRNDVESGGALDHDDVGTTGNFHAESIFFPTDQSAPAGLYQFWVTQHYRAAASATQWKLRVYKGDTLIRREAGTFETGAAGLVMQDGPILSYEHVV